MTFNQLSELLLAQLYLETEAKGHDNYISLDHLASTVFGENDSSKVMKIAQHLEGMHFIQAVLVTGPRSSAVLTGDGIRYVEEGGRTGLIPLYFEAAKSGQTTRFFDDLRSGAVEDRIKAAQEAKMAKSSTKERGEEQASDQGVQKIFLSHKGVNKPLVRQFYRVLKCIGFQPWLDEEAMPAGTALERGILQGFEDSCAAVFFITPEFKDEGYLATEINYAIDQKRNKGKRFAIITMVFVSKGRKGEVPPLLKPYVWNNVSKPMEALENILKALPIRAGKPEWCE